MSYEPPNFKAIATEDDARMERLNLTPSEKRRVTELYNRAEVKYRFNGYGNPPSDSIAF